MTLLEAGAAAPHPAPTADPHGNPVRTHLAPLTPPDRPHWLDDTFDDRAYAAAIDARPILAA